MEKLLQNVLATGAAISKAYASPAPESQAPNLALPGLSAAMLDALNPDNAPAALFTDEMR